MENLIKAINYRQVRQCKKASHMQNGEVKYLTSLKPSNLEIVNGNKIWFLLFQSPPGGKGSCKTDADCRTFNTCAEPCAFLF